MTKHYHVIDPQIGHCLVIVPDGRELPAEYADSAKLMDVPDDWSKSSLDSVTQKIDPSWPWIPAIDEAAQ